MIRLRPPRADAALALLLVGLATTLFIAWPDRAVDANGAWYALAIARLSGLMLLGAALGLQPLPSDPHARSDRVQALTFAWALTLPFETVAFYATVPAASLAWSLAIALPATITAYGASAGLAAVARRSRMGWALPLLAPLLALGIGAVDVRTDPVLILPWLLPFAPSWAGAVLLGASATTTVAVGVVGARCASRRSETAT